MTQRYVVACDAGGTMTDVIIVDDQGNSVIGKAPTAPRDESIGYMESFWDLGVLPAMAEFTMHQQHAPTLFVYGVLAGADPIPG